MHRIGAPACVHQDGGFEWYLNGKMHREDGPAWYFAGKHTYEWRVHGVLQSKSQVLRRIKKFGLSPLLEGVNYNFAPERPKLKKLKIWHERPSADVLNFLKSDGYSYLRICFNLFKC